MNYLHLAAAPDSPVAHFLLALCRSDAPAAALAHVEDALGLAPYHRPRVARPPAGGRRDERAHKTSDGAGAPALH